MATPSANHPLVKFREREHARVLRENAAFKKMSKAQQRVVGAQDVLRWLANGRLKAQRGKWLLLSRRNIATSEGFWTQGLRDGDMRDALLKETTCQGCALGSLLACMVARVDKLPIKDAFYASSLGHSKVMVSRDPVFSYLQKFFSIDQLRLMEVAFERGGGDVYCDNSAQRLAARIFGKRYHSSAARLRAIMRNVVRNKGTFVLPKDVLAAGHVERRRQQSY